MSDWTPIEDNTPNPFNERMATYRYAATWEQFVAWLVGIVIIAGTIILIFRAVWLDTRHILIPPVSTPMAEWTETP